MKHEMPTLFWALAKQVCGLMYNTNGRTKSKYTYICCANEKCARVSDLLHITFSVNWSYSFGIMPAHVYPLLLVKLSMLEFSAKRAKFLRSWISERQLLEIFQKWKFIRLNVHILFLFQSFFLQVQNCYD